MQWVPDAHALASTILLLSRFLMSITFPLRIKRIARRGRPSYFSGESRGLGSRLPFRSCFCCRLIEMNLLVHVIDPIDPDEVLPAARFRIVLAQYDAIGGLQVV